MKDIGSIEDNQNPDVLLTADLPKKGLFRNPVFSLVVLPYVIVSVFCGLFWFWFGGNFHLGEDTGFMPELSYFLTGMSFGILIVGPILVTIILLLKRKFRYILYWLLFTAFVWFLFFGYRFFI